MSKFIEWHKRKVEWWSDKLRIGWYGIAWISFLKGIILTTIVFAII